MATIIVSVGVDADNGLVNLYTGPSYAHAEKALYEAGLEGRISEGWIFNNPESTVHQWYDLKAPESSAPLDPVKRGPGRPRKEPLPV